MNVIIIGASSGIGKELVLQIAAADNQVGIIGRRAALLQEIAAQNSRHIYWEAADITQPAEFSAAFEALIATLGGLDLCVLSAGTGEINPSLDFALEEPTIRTNVLGWTNAVDRIYRYFERQGSGHLVVITSVSGVRGSRVAPAYNASKAYQINYAEGLRQKAAKAGLPIQITDIRPGLVDTRMAKGEGLFWVMPIEKCTRQILRAIRRRRATAVVTRRWQIVAWVLKRLPEVIYRKL